MIRGHILLMCMEMSPAQFGARARHLYAVACGGSVMLCISRDNELVYEASKYSDQLQMYGALRFVRF